MKDYIYDGSFEGLLTAIFYAYKYGYKANVYNKYEYTPSLLNEHIYIPTELDKFNRVYKSIEEKLNDEILQNIYFLYLCGINGSDNLSYKYLRLCYQCGSKINLAKNNDIIILVDKYTRKVTNEVHKFLGFVRFKEIAPLSYYSSIEPDHNILPLILNHFTKRFNDQNFIIHDLKRETAIIYNTHSAEIVHFNKLDAQRFINSKSDSEFENLWKTFYHSVNIEERENQRLRRQFMPKRYWKHITEVK